jgi:hypothetical protein
VQVIEPDATHRERYEQLLSLFTESYLALAPVYAKLAANRI